MSRPEDQKAELSQLDLCLCVDLTGSMTPFIEEARRRLSEILSAVAEKEGLELRVAIVGYRDYGTGVPLTQHTPFESALKRIQRELSSLEVKSPRENTDAAEAVIAGLLAAVDELSWRARATKIIVLVGDAPPHGCETMFGPFPDRYAEDPTGLSLLEAGARIEGAGITLYALGMIPSVTPAYDKAVEQSFGKLARTTGGIYRNARDAASAVSIVEEISAKVSRQVGLERLLWSALSQRRREDDAISLRAMVAAEIDALAASLESDAESIYAAVARLEKRGFS